MLWFTIDYTQWTRLNKISSAKLCKIKSLFTGLNQRQHDVVQALKQLAAYINQEKKKNEFPETKIHWIWNSDAKSSINM